MSSDLFAIGARTKHTTAIAADSVGRKGAAVCAR
jgi:hypothetical protein